MARKITTVSDISGKEVPEEEAGTLYVRRGKGVDKPRAFDIVEEDVKDLIEASDVFVIGIKMNGDVEEREMVVTAKELAKLAPSGALDEMLANARYAQGRRPLGR